ncbi:MAG: hypothetical protein QOK38_2488, partial [Acidobacteriaceae bacterium]|nr:hypothetical protein [Acidobacteriaceae bacterium]
MRLAPAFPLQPCLLPLGWRTLCGAAANDDACTLLSGSGDRRFVFTLDRRVRDLKDIENTHGNVVHQMGQCAGHADKPHHAGLSELQERFERAVLLQGLPGWRGVKLDDVEIVGLHPHKTLFDPGHDVVAGEDVLPALAARCRRRAD